MGNITLMAVFIFGAAVITGITQHWLGGFCLKCWSIPKTEIRYEGSDPYKAMGAHIMSKTCRCGTRDVDSRFLG